MSDKKEIEPYLVGNYALSIPMPPNGAQLQLSGQILSTHSFEDISRNIDLMQDVAQRQLTRQSIELMESQRKAQLAHLGSIQAIYGQLADQVKRGEKLKTTQKQQYDQGQTTIDQVLKNIKEIEQNIADAKKKIQLTG